ncbi:MAG: hypothetical protein HYU52_16090, partial [Acidobacteria bacterium]|nr:hypothetical protein [Acidobacteriota bacterium]
AGIVALVAASLLLCLPAFAVTVDPAPDVRSFSGVSEKNAIPAHFKLHLVVTEDEAQLRAWLSKKESQRARLETRRFKPDQPGKAALVLTGYDVPGFDPVDLLAEVRLYAPDGKLIYTHPDVARSAWGQPKKGYLALLPQVGFSFDADDPKGSYLYEAIVRDRATNEVARAQVTIELQ